VKRIDTGTSSSNILI